MKKGIEAGLDEALDLREKGGISRRDFVKFLGLAGAAAGLVGGPFSTRLWAADSIRFDGWGGRNIRSVS